METVRASIPAPDRAEAIFEAVVKVAYGFSNPTSIHRADLRVEGHGLKTGASSAQLPYRVTIKPIGELASEILLEIDLEDSSPGQMIAKDLLIQGFSRAGHQTIKADGLPTAASMFDQWSPLKVAEIFQRTSILVFIVGCLVFIISVFIFLNPIERPVAWVVVVTLGAEMVGTVVAVAILLYLGYALKLLSTTRDAVTAPITSEWSNQS